MRVKFYDWVQNQVLPDESKELFFESIKCYQTSAYRAALLFSYLGFQTVLKHRILNSRTPSGYVDGEWKQVQKGVQNDDSWEKRVIEAVQNKRKPVFVLSEDLNEQYFYWKNRRNDCAHAKGNIIGYSHVESFWLFVESNLSKFVVNGGKSHILEQIKEYYDPNITPLGTDCSQILSHIPNAIEDTDYQEFLEELLIFSKDVMSKTTFGNSFDRASGIIWTNLFHLPTIFVGKLVDFLTLEENHLFTLNLFRYNNDVIKHFYNKDAFIRNTWKQHFSSAFDYTIFINFLRNKFIPSEQLAEAFDHMVSTIDADCFDDNAWWGRSISDLDRLTLMDCGFFNYFYESAFLSSKIVTDFKWGNRNTELVLFYIKYFGLNETIVYALNRAVTTNYPPRLLRDNLCTFYKLNMSIWEVHNKITLEHGGELPELLNLQQYATDVKEEVETF